MTVIKLTDTTLGTIVHNGKAIQIAFDSNYLKIYGFETSPSSQIFEIDFAKYGDELKIYLIKVYESKENQGIGTKALIYFEEWALKNGFKKIIGELVNGKDSSSPDKLKYFYSKNHYNTEETEDDYIYAKISKSLI